MEATINILLQSEKYINTNIPQDKIHNLLITCLSIGKEYAHLPEVEGVTIGGSLGRGLHDEKSDIEMYIYYNNILPSQKAIKHIIHEKLKGVLTRSQDVHWYHEARGYHSFFKINDTSVELGYRELGEVKKKIQIFKEKFLLPQHGLHDTPFGHYYSGIPACIKDSTIILDKNNKLTELKNKLTPFPKKIKDETIQYYFNDAFFLFRDKLVTAGTRKDTFLFHACVARIIKSLIILTFTLNNVYYPGDKRNNAYLKNFNIIPVGFIDKLNNIYNKFDGTQESYNYTIEILGGLINEYETIVTIQHQNITIKIPNLNAGKKNNTQ